MYGVVFERVGVRSLKALSFLPHGQQPECLNDTFPAAFGVTKIQSESTLPVLSAHFFSGVKFPTLAVTRRREAAQIFLDDEAATLPASLL